MVHWWPAVMQTLPRFLIIVVSLGIAFVMSRISPGLLISKNISAQVTYESQFKELEANCVSVLNAFPIGLALVALDGKILKVNHALTAMLGYSEKELIASGFDKITHGDDLKMDQQYLRKLFNREINLFQVDKRLIKADGESVWIQQIISIVMDTNNSPKYLISQVMDVSQGRMAEKEIHEIVKQRTRALEATNRELEAFSYSVSHDLRSPLRSIHGFSQALLEDYFGQLDLKGIDYLNRISAATVRMGNLIDDLLKLTRITSHSLTIDSIDVSGLAEQVAENLKRNQYFLTQFVIDPDLTTVADHGLLSVVLANLFENAAKYSRDVEHPSVKFGVKVINGRKTFYIKDNGVGFEMQHADKLFKPFQRLHTNKEFEGTGIGLATVKRIVNRHGGEIWTESKIGKGSIFYFTLPEKETI